MIDSDQAAWVNNNELDTKTSVKPIAAPVVESFSEPSREQCKTLRIKSDPVLTREQMHQSMSWDWQKVTANTVNDVSSLASLLKLDHQMLDNTVRGNDFKLRVPLPFISRMRTADLNDPLLLQVLPLKQEQQEVLGNSVDPLDEKRYNVLPGLVHKYQGRVLLTAAVSCPINCRYCFRRHFAYEDNRLTPSSWNPVLDYIRSDNTIEEVILSGGEPLLLNDGLICRLLDELESIEHVQHIRIHSRYPIVIPQRLTDALCARLINARCNMALVLHCNHPNEVDDHVGKHLQSLVNSPVTLLNQSVLLRQVNDDVNTLKRLSETLYSVGVLPYYLHATDPVVGTAHFQVTDAKAKQLTGALTQVLPGYLVPTLVREVSGKRAKTRLPLAEPDANGTIR